MIDPRREAVLILNLDKERFEDRTYRISRYEKTAAGGTIRITFGDKSYSYRPDRVRILRGPRRTALDERTGVEVRGSVWAGATELWTFTGPAGESWSRVFYRTQHGEGYRTYPSELVRLVECASRGSPGAAGVLGYLRAIAARLPDSDSLRRPYDSLDIVHPDSVLASYLTGAPIRVREPVAAPIYPFHCNPSQRAAVENGLTRSISVVEGPPGTGKTETILNLVANIIVNPNLTVGVVSFTNAAVDNVRGKLEDNELGHVIASLGRYERREQFLETQAARNEQVDVFVAAAPPPPDRERLADLDRALRRLQDAERDRAQRRQEVAAYRLELRHFELHLSTDELPELANLPLLRRSADRILDYLAETELENRGRGPGLLRRIRKYFRYGSLRGLDPRDTAVVLRLQRAYYDKRIAELDAEITALDTELREADFDTMVADRRVLGDQLLRAELAARYRCRGRRTYAADYKWGKNFLDFVADYPVLLSSCHSVRSSIADGYLLDYLIIDEASQVDPLLAGLALSCCRNLVVVGDQRQLPPIPSDAAADLDPPDPAYDCRVHSIISSLSALYGDALPRTLLREHYRCDPAIIGFCNKKFYDDSLIPYTTGGAAPSMLVVPTAEGSHMRRHSEGGRSNQREIDVIEQEVIPHHCAGFPDAEIGVTTAYRRQADKVSDLLDQIDADTVHKFQGRQKQVVILSAVLDETRQGRIGLRFGDSAQLINVAVSRAVALFILVIDHDMLPTSRNIRDLVGHIRYQNPGEAVPDSAVVSIFDLLYRRYSQRLEALAARVGGESRYPSENIAAAMLDGVLAEGPYTHLRRGAGVLLRNLLPDLGGLTEEQHDFVRHRASVDFVVFNRVTNRPLLAIEVDGFAYHEDNPRQLRRDRLKDAILAAHQLPLLRLPTTGSGERERVRTALDEADPR